MAGTALMTVAAAMRAVAVMAGTAIAAAAIAATAVVTALVAAAAVIATAVVAAAGILLRRTVCLPFAGRGMVMRIMRSMSRRNAPSS